MSSNETHDPGLGADPGPLPSGCILLLGSDSDESRKLNIDGEFLDIVQVFTQPKQDHFQVVQHRDVGPAQILDLLDAHAPVLVHFSGHGTEDGDFIMLDQKGTPQPADMESLAAFLHPSSVRCVVLSCCDSAKQQQAMEHLESCVAINGKIWDESARAFAVRFYKRICQGDSVRAAYCAGYHALGMVNNPNKSLLRLYERGKLVWETPPKVIPRGSGSRASKRAEALLIEHFESSAADFEQLLAEITGRDPIDFAVGFYNAMRALHQRGGAQSSETAQQLMDYFLELMPKVAPNTRPDPKGRPSMSVQLPAALEPTMAARAQRALAYLPGPRVDGDLHPSYHVEVNELPEAGLSTEARVRQVADDIATQNAIEQLAQSLLESFPAGKAFGSGSARRRIKRMGISIKREGKPRYALLKQQPKLDRLITFLEQHTNELELVVSSAAYDEDAEDHELELCQTMVDFYDLYDQLVSPP